ncbi:MAG: DUF1080 domain-containing protein [Acidobacteria bacterium]|nr:DUF1080 domain-containing protein [Acidobacteriota bacterium]
MQTTFLFFLLAQSLFNGKNLDGWMWSHDPNPPQPSWAARNGTLITTPGEGKEVYLITRQAFEDFDLTLEWRASPGANSGIKYRIQSYGESSRRLEPTGLEYQITDDLANPDSLSTPRHSAGALYDYIAPTKSKPATPNTWHTSRILARGLHIEHWLDGERVINTDLDSTEAEQSFNLSPRKSRHMLRKQEKRSSPIALQIHDGTVEFRNLQIKPLK